MKTQSEIYAGLKQRFSELTGLAMNDGGDMALRLAAVAAELFSLWTQADFVARQAFPQTGSGTYLDYHAEMRGLSRSGAEYARGVLRFYSETAAWETLEIPAGTVCRTEAGTEFISLESCSIAAGAVFADVPARAVLKGKSGNVPANAVTVMVLAPSGVTGCANPELFTGGEDDEDDGHLRARVVSSYRKLPNGANAAYYETQVLNMEGVLAVKVLPKVRGLCTVDIVLTSESGVPEPELLASVQAALDTQREICVDIDVLAPGTVTVDVAASIDPGEGYDYGAVAAAVEYALRSHFDGSLLGRDLLMAELADIIYSVEGVLNYRLAAPAADISLDADQLPVLGTLSLSRMGV